MGESEMKTLIACILSLALIGCTTAIPLKPRFPEPPAELMEKPPALLKL